MFGIKILKENKKSILLDVGKTDRELNFYLIKISMYQLQYYQEVKNKMLMKRSLEEREAEYHEFRYNALVCVILLNLL